MSTLSYVSGASEKPLIGLTLGQQFDAACAQYAERDALISHAQGIRLTYAQLQQQVNQVACALLRLGFKSGDRLGIWSPNCAEWALTQFATHKIGVILVNMNPSYRRTELDYAINKVSCRGLVMATSFKDSDYEAMLAELVPELAEHSIGTELQAARAPSLRHVIRIDGPASRGMLGFADLLAEPSSEELAQLAEIGSELQFDQAINIQFTSGTTGSPKGTMLTHHNILNNGYFVGETMKLTEQDKVCIPVPLFHCFGMVMGNLACISHGSAMVYPSLVFNPLDTLQAIHDEQCTAAFGVPTMFIAMMEHPRFAEFDMSHLRTGIMAGTTCPAEVMKQVIAKMNLSEMTICYGMTETSPVSMQTHTDDPFDKKVNTVGRIHPHVEVKIVDPFGNIVPRGESGELCTRGYSVMLGYWEDEAKTRESIDSAGWMHTGDLAVIDEEGYGKIVGRIKDLVIRGGENLFPREIEDFFYTHPDILDVQVIGVPDDKYGEELCAWIILRPNVQVSEQDIRDYCEGEISRQKIPRYIKFVTEFPMTGSGKVQKFKMREMMKEQIKS